MIQKKRNKIENFQYIFFTKTLVNLLKIAIVFLFSIVIIVRKFVYDWRYYYFVLF